MGSIIVWGILGIMVGFGLSLVITPIVAILYRMTHPAEREAARRYQEAEAKVAAGQAYKVTAKLVDSKFKRYGHTYNEYQDDWREKCRYEYEVDGTTYDYRTVYDYGDNLKWSAPGKITLYYAKNPAKASPNGDWKSGFSLLRTYFRTALVLAVLILLAGSVATGLDDENTVNALRDISDTVNQMAQ